MPRVQEPRSFSSRKIHVPLGEEIAQRSSVKLIEVPPWPLAPVDSSQHRPETGAPGVGQLLRITRYLARVKRPCDAGAPVHQRPEHVENQSWHSHKTSLSRAAFVSG